MTSRNSDRLHVVFPIRGIGTDADGKSFEAAGRTVAISRNGAAIVLNHHLTEGQEIIVRRLDSGRETTVRVLTPTVGQSREIVYGVVFVNPAVNLWDVEFPQLSGLEEPLARVLLRCDLCGRLEVVHLDEVDMEVLEKIQQIGRFCKLCSALTSWRQGSDKAKKQQVLMPELEPRNKDFDLPVQLKSVGTVGCGPPLWHAFGNSAGQMMSSRARIFRAEGCVFEVAVAIPQEPRSR